MMEESASFQGRQLSEEELQKLEKDVKLVSEFKQSKLEKEAQKNWDLFYKRNTTRFFKDRHWTRREFSELVHKESRTDKLVIFEVGCGVGNFMFPLLEEDKSLYFYACDFSKRAVQFVKENPAFDPDRCTAFHCDITEDDLTNRMSSGSVDVATLIFVLSAIHPNKMETSLRKILTVLKPGGCLLIRDYGLYDHAMLRFAPGHKLADNFYVRQDGTRAFYFSLDVLENLMKSAGFECITCEYIQRQTVNKKEGLSVPRVFVQGKFQKPELGGTVLDQTDCVSKISSKNDPYSDGDLVPVTSNNCDDICLQNICTNTCSTGRLPARFNEDEAGNHIPEELIHFAQTIVDEQTADKVVTDNVYTDKKSLHDSGLTLPSGMESMSIGRTEKKTDSQILETNSAAQEFSS